MFFGGPGGGFPFPGMEGGMPGGGGRRGPKKDVDNEKFYNLLEVDKNAGDAEIKKAYRKLAVKHHPDKGGDPEKFKEISKAYETLSNSEKRAKYDRFGEEGLDGDGPGGDPSDIFEAFFGGGGGRRGGGQKRRAKTKDVVQPLQVTLEQIYSGQTKKMAITRKVIDKAKGVKKCEECNGRGVKVEVVRMGPMIQQMQQPCSSCNGQGTTYTLKSEREILEVHIQKGCPDGHTIPFRAMADEQHEADTGDVIFVVKEKEHADIKRKGADLYIERTISLSEALCGFKMDFTHLDGRKLLIQTSPGDIIKPLLAGFDPLETKPKKMEWEKIDDVDCNIDTSAKADMADPETLKQACETQLKRQGVNVGAFVIDNGKAYFKACTREEALAAKKNKKGATMYVLADPNAGKELRVMKAVKGEGMPTFKNPFQFGNLFLILTIEFPNNLDASVQADMKKLLPPALLPPPQSKPEDCEEHFLKDIDPISSYNENKLNMQTGGASAYDDDDDEAGPGGGGGGPQCQQM